MAEEKKSGWFSVKGIVTGVVCAAIGAGASIGIIDLNKVQDTITAAQARQIVVAAAAYSAESAAGQAIVAIKSDISLSEKAKVVTAAAKTAIENAKVAADTIINGALSDAKEGGLTKENIEGAKEAAKDAANTVKAKASEVKEAVAKKDSAASAKKATEAKK